MKEAHEYLDEYYDTAAKEALDNDYLREEMNDLKREALGKLNAVIHPSTEKQLENFAFILALGCEMQVEEALTLADDANLCEAEIAALQDDLEGYIENLADMRSYDD